MKNFLKLRKDIIEFAFRINLSIAFLSYGYSKIRGTMFKNELANMIDLNLSQIDMFHLTWYWFDKNKELSILIGIVQIFSALLLIFNRTKIIGALMFLPIISGILMVDIFCAQSAGLTGRVSFYLCICLAILFRNRDRLSLLLISEKTMGMPQNRQATTSILIYLIQLLIFLLLAFAAEFSAVALFNVCHQIQS